MNIINNPIIYFFSDNVIPMILLIQLYYNKYMIIPILFLILIPIIDIIINILNIKFVNKIVYNINNSDYYNIKDKAVYFKHKDILNNKNDNIANKLHYISNNIFNDIHNNIMNNKNIEKHNSINRLPKITNKLYNNIYIIGKCAVKKIIYLWMYILNNIKKIVIKTIFYFYDITCEFSRNGYLYDNLIYCKNGATKIYDNMCVYIYNITEIYNLYDYILIYNLLMQLMIYVLYIGVFIKNNYIYNINYIVLSSLSLGIYSAINITTIHELIHKNKYIKNKLFGIRVGDNEYIKKKINIYLYNFVNKLIYITLFINCYTHFPIYHIYVHHVYVGTDNDPSTAKINSSLYNFILTSYFMGIYETIKISNNMTNKKLQNDKNNNMDIYNKLPDNYNDNKNSNSNVDDTYNNINNDNIVNKKYNIYNNVILRYTNNIQIINIIIQFVIFVILYYINIYILLWYLLQSFISIFIIESVNYFEHYGLTRGKNNKITSRLSWDSKYTFFMYFIKNINFHSFHHLKPNYSFRELKIGNPNSTPYLPYSYPTMVILSMIPCLYIKIMNNIIHKFNKKNT